MRNFFLTLIIAVITIGCGEIEKESKTVTANPPVGECNGYYPVPTATPDMARLVGRLRFLDRLTPKQGDLKAHLQIREKGIGEDEFVEYIDKQLNFTDYQIASAYRNEFYLTSCATYRYEEERFEIVSAHGSNGRALEVSLVLPDPRSQYSLGFWIDVDKNGQLSEGDFIQKEEKVFYHDSADLQKFDIEMIEFHEEVISETVKLQVELFDELNEVSSEAAVLFYFRYEDKSFVQTKVTLAELLELEGVLAVDEVDPRNLQYKVLIDENDSGATDEGEWVSEWVDIGETSILSKR